MKREERAHVGVDNAESRAFCRDKQKGETEVDGALIASAIDVRDRFNLRRPSTCVYMWMSAYTDECVCVRALSYKRVHRTGIWHIIRNRGRDCVENDTY